MHKNPQIMRDFVHDPNDLDGLEGLLQGLRQRPIVRYDLI
jgi:hypothetical protein